MRFNIQVIVCVTTLLKNTLCTCVYISILFMHIKWCVCLWTKFAFQTYSIRCTKLDSMPIKSACRAQKYCFWIQAVSTINSNCMFLPITKIVQGDYIFCENWGFNHFQPLHILSPVCVQMIDNLTAFEILVWHSWYIVHVLYCTL
jgi:hypothetical protein